MARGRWLVCGWQDRVRPLLCDAGRMDASGGRSARLRAVLDAVDALNAQDPRSITVDGVERPKEPTHAEMMTRWVRALDPAASDEQLIAARAHHLRRWVVPRHTYPDGRAGYLRWRTALRRRHADEVGEIMRGAGYGDEAVARVQAIVGKLGLGRDHDVQVHEDALCLVFLETQLDELVQRLDEEKVVEILRKTAAKMSPAGLAAATALPLPASASALVDRALGEA
ncbi:MAG TPA: DUF4202 domain-containing protein [Acidimicrobiales bacterium]|nr:DUF4202 domain-containing protein [Acidimicrobiales bacterium]